AADSQSVELAVSSGAALVPQGRRAVQSFRRIDRAVLSLLAAASGDVGRALYRALSIHSDSERQLVVAELAHHGAVHRLLRRSGAATVDSPQAARASARAAGSVAAGSGSLFRAVRADRRSEPAAGAQSVFARAGDERLVRSSAPGEHLRRVRL